MAVDEPSIWEGGPLATRLRVAKAPVQRYLRGVALGSDGDRPRGIARVAIGNNAAFLLAKSGAWRGGPGQEVEPLNPVSKAAWQTAAKALSRQGAVAAMPIPIYSKAGAPMGFASLRPYGRFADGQNLPHYVLTVNSISYGSSAGLLTGLKAVFGLTPSEAALAPALYESGDLADAANALNISVPSARTRLQSVFQKTGTRRQIDLVRMLEALTASLG